MPDISNTNPIATAYTVPSACNREVPHNVIYVSKNVVDLRKVLRKLHADLCSAI